MESSPIDKFRTQALEAQVIEVLRTIYDPEFPVSIYEFGLIYDVAVEATGVVDLKMTLTSPACPVATALPPEVKSRVERIDGVKEVTVEVVWDPPWTPERMSAAARLELGV